MENKGNVGIGSVEESLCEEEFDSDRCFRHPDNGGDCRHHWLRDKIRKWEKRK
jgi:hypothetical protein